MFATLFLALAPGQYVDSKDFPRDKQEAALAATAGIFQPTTRADGTAVIVKHRDGVVYLLTAAHNVPAHGGKVVRLELYSPKTYPKVHVELEGTVRARMVNEDLAVVTAALKDPPGVLPICPKSLLPTPEPQRFPVLTAGCDGRLSQPTLLTDSVRGKFVPIKPDRTKVLCWETERAQARGRSGGPLIDKRGYVMGICSGVQNQRGYYTYIGEIHQALKDEGFEWLADK